MNKRVFYILGLAVFLAACASAISQQGMKQADPSISFQALQKEPERFKGKVVLVGGQIVAVTSKEGETWIEVLQQPLDWQQKPEATDVSYGRFLARFTDFRDPVIYVPGRKITVLGEVQGKKVQTLREIEYSYPVILPRESHLWKPEDPSSGPFFHFGIGVGVIR